MRVLLFVFLPFVLTQNCYTYVGDVLIDLSPLHGQSVETKKTNGYQYYFSPCKNEWIDKAASLCQIDSTSTFSAISKFDSSVQWSSGPDFVQMTTQNGAHCSAYSIPRAATIRFMCGLQNSLVVASLPTPSTCYELPGFSFIMYTPLMCQYPTVHALYMGSSSNAFAGLSPFSPSNDADRTVFAYVYVPYIGTFEQHLPIWRIEDGFNPDAFSLSVNMVSWGSGPSQSYFNFILTSASSTIESTGFNFNQWYLVVATYCPVNRTHSLSVRSETATGPAGWVTTADDVSGFIENTGASWSISLSHDTATQRGYPGLLVQYFTAYSRVMSIAEIMTIGSERSSGLNVSSTNQIFNWDWTPASYQQDTVHGISLGFSGNVGLAVKCETGVTFSSNGWSLPQSCQPCSTCPNSYTTLCSANHDAVCAPCVQDGCESSFWENGQCVCTQCSSLAFQLVNGTCQYCPVYDCESYFEACVCLSCTVGYQLINNTCEYCSNAGCDLYDYGSCTCMACYAGYALVGGTCQYCGTDTFPNCMEYGYVGACICSACDPGYVMSGGFCTYDDSYNYDDSNSNNTLWISTPVGCSALILMLGILVRRRRVAAAAAAAAANNNARQPLLVAQPVSAAPALRPRVGAAGAAGKKPKAPKKKNNKAALVSPVAGAAGAAGAGGASGVAGEPQEGLSSGGSGAAMGPPGGMACNDVDVYGEGNEHPEGVGGYYRYDEENARGEDDGTIG